MSAALQLVKPASYQPEPRVLTDTAIGHLANLNAATRRLRMWGIRVEKIDPYNARWQCPVITIRRNVAETIRPFLDASVPLGWCDRVCFVSLSGCVVTWTES